MNTPEIIAEGCQNQSTIESFSPVLPHPHHHVSVVHPVQGDGPAGRRPCLLCPSGQLHLPGLQPLPDLPGARDRCTRAASAPTSSRMSTSRRGRSTRRSSSTPRALTITAATPTGRTARSAGPSSAPRGRPSPPRSCATLRRHTARKWLTSWLPTATPTSTSPTELPIVKKQPTGAPAAVFLRCSIYKLYQYFQISGIV